MFSINGIRPNRATLGSGIGCHQQEEKQMASYNMEILISGGNPDDQHSHGKFWIDIDLDTREVAVSLPNRFGILGETYTFAADDWDAIVKVINDAELQRGKIVSTTWNGQ
ncbi:hypothetical protein [Mycolicibacterium neoaurum]|uniref:hypothetical protein n=1 Tax=Mycolicibacterium neoaurum TaxID=1795 RepID=UPI001F4C66A0|nr:hypothetical protein [Mycolicibacterium neoaurum]